MKKFMYLFLLISILCLICSCKSEPDVYEPDYSAFKPDLKNNSFTADLSKPDDNLTVPNPTEEANIKDTKNSEESKKSEKQWPYELDFTGVESKIKGKTGNLVTNTNMFDHMLDKNYSYLLCPDYVNGVTYYVNIDDDNYIYQLKDGVSTLLIEKEANYLQLWDNKLYFLSHNHKYEDRFTGDIYCFDLENKELKLILKDDARSLYIDSYGIYYNKHPLKSYRLDFGSDTPQELSYAFLFSYNEYEIQSIEDKGIFLVNRETEEKHLLIPPENMSYYVSLYSDYFTFINRTCVCMINLLTGERKIYDFNDCKNLVGDAYIFSFVIFDDIIYASPTGPRIYRYDMTNETAEFFNYPVDNINAGNHLLGLFTDGTNLYTVMERYGKKKLYMVTRFGENDFGFSIFEMKPLLE